MLLLLACVEVADPLKEREDPEVEESAADDRILDLTQEYGNSTPGFAVLKTPIFDVPAHTELMYCSVGTWSEPSAGVVNYHFTQALPHGHHAQLMYSRTPSSQLPDGSIVDCTTGGSIDATPLFQNAQNGQAMLPEGMALYLPEGTRWVIQSHYINTTDDILRVNDAFFLEYVPEEDVELWASSWTFGNSELEIPPTEYVEAFDCAWPQDFTLLSLSPHMHEFGVSLQVEWEHEGELQSIYEIEPWNARYRDDPPVHSFGSGLEVTAGDNFRVSCNYNNTSSETLYFPQEMCGVYGLGYSSRAPVNCNIGVPQPM